ncbi:hypothetical protein F4808DRAFT_401716 [Astrocystis sublimbata]|nr:hypothetical protein F4808DRAFT_401716 [Astrocystis sublimbata]
MATPAELHADRLQRKRIQNREAQQKYRTRVKERMNALERQIKELKSQANVPEAALGGAQQQTQQQIGHPLSACPPNPLPDFASPGSYHAETWIWDQLSSAKSATSQAMESSSPAMDLMLTPSSTCNHEQLFPLSAPPQPLSEHELIGDFLLSDGMNTGQPQLQSQVSSLNSTGHAELREKLQGQTLEKRLEFLHLCLTSAGFESFDSLVSQYYTSTLSPESVVSSHQRTSRQRDLPVLLADLRRYVRTWTQWEAHGYYYEIIKSAESIVGGERDAANAHDGNSVDFANALQQLTKTADVSLGSDSLSGALQLLMRGFQKIV